MPPELAALLATGAGALVLQRDWLASGLGAARKVSLSLEGLKDLRLSLSGFSVADVIDLGVLDVDVLDVHALDPDLADLDFSPDDVLGVGQILGPALAVYREAKIVASGAASLSAGARNAGLVIGSSVVGRAIGAGFGFVGDAATGGASMGMGTIVGGKIGAAVGRWFGERKRLAPLRAAQAEWKLRTEEGDAAIGRIVEGARRELAGEISRQESVLNELELQYQRELAGALERGRAVVAAAAAGRLPVAIDRFEQHLGVLVDRLDPSVCNSSRLPKWLLRRVAAKRLAQWHGGISRLLELDLTNAEHRKHVVEALSAAPGGVKVAGDWLRHVDAFEREVINEVESRVASLTLRLRAAEAQARAVVDAREAELREKAQAQADPVLGNLRRAADSVRAAGRGCPEFRGTSVAAR